MKFSFRKIGSILASGAMLSSTVALAAAANFPAPFVQGGAASVAIVHGGADAAYTDLVAVADITSFLSTRLASNTAAGGSGGETTVSGEGDYVVLAKSADKVNIGDTVSTVFGTTVDDDDLPNLLKDGVYKNDENTEYKYEQKITLGSWSLSHFADSDYKKKEPTVGVRIPATTFILNYTIDFITDPESDITSGDLVDFETTDIEMFGRTYYISDFDRTALNESGTITLLDSAITGDVSEGETTTATLGDTTYEVSLTFIDNDEVKFSVNGEQTNTLQAGQSYRLSDGTYVGAKDITKIEVSGSIGNAEFSLGSGKLEIINGANVELNDDTITEIIGYVQNSAMSSGRERLSKITLEWSADEDEFIAPGEGELVMPGFEVIKLSAGTLKKTVEEVVSVDWDGTDSIELTAPIKSGIASFNILYANSSGEFQGTGKDSTQLLVTTNDSKGFVFNITDNKDEWFVASYATSSQAESHLLKVPTITNISNAAKITIRDAVTNEDVCKEKAKSDTCDIGDVTLTITELVREGGNKWANITGGSNVEFHRLYTKEGLRIDLPFAPSKYEADMGAVPNGAMNFTNKTTVAGHDFDSMLLWFDEEDKDDTIGAGPREFNLTINDDTDGDLHVTDIALSGDELEILETDSDTEDHVNSDLGSKGVRKVSSSKGQAEITYYGSQVYSDIILSDLTATITTTEGTGGGGSGVPLGSISVPDTEVSSVSGKNLIVIGGSCVNSEAARLLSLASPTCGSAWTAATGVASGEYLIQTFSRTGGKVATLVAGTDAGDTTNAARALTTKTDIDTTVGKKYKGTTATAIEAVMEDTTTEEGSA